MERFPRPVVRRTREHLLYALGIQQKLCYVQNDIGHDEALVSADGVDSAWHWPEALIRQAAQQLERAGLVETALIREDRFSCKPVFLITLTAKGLKSLPNRKRLPRHKSSVESPARQSSCSADGAAVPPSPAVVSTPLPF